MFIVKGMATGLGGLRCSSSSCGRLLHLTRQLAALHFLRRQLDQHQRQDMHVDRPWCMASDAQFYYSGKELVQMQSDVVLRMQEAGIPAKFAPTIGIAVDHRRKNRSLEGLQVLSQ